MGCTVWCNCAPLLITSVRHSKSRGERLIGLDAIAHRRQVVIVEADGGSGGYIP